MRDCARVSNSLKKLPIFLSLCVLYVHVWSVWYGVYGDSFTQLCTFLNSVCMRACVCLVTHLLRWRDALLLVELCALLGLDVQAEALLESLRLQHEGGAQPQVVRLAQVLQHARPDGDGRHALRHGLHEAVERARLAVPLRLVAAAAQKRAHLAAQRLPGTGQRSTNQQQSN